MTRGKLSKEFRDRKFPKTVQCSHEEWEDGEPFFDVQIHCTRQQFAEHAALICEAVPSESCILQCKCDCCSDEILRFPTESEHDAIPIIDKILLALDTHRVSKH
jgi:hypothetical protein